MLWWRVGELAIPFPPLPFPFFPKERALIARLSNARWALAHSRSEGNAKYIKTKGHGENHAISAASKHPDGFFHILFHNGHSLVTRLDVRYTQVGCAPVGDRPRQ